MLDKFERKAVLDRLHRAINGLGFDETIVVMDEEIADPRNAEYRSYFEMRKAQILGAYGRKREAADILKRCAAENEDNDEVQYFAGEALLEAGDFSLASRHFTCCIDISEASGEDYYLDSAYLLRAYCAAKTGKFALARQDLTHIDDDGSMHWLDADPLVSKASIECMVDAIAAGPKNEN